MIKRFIFFMGVLPVTALAGYDDYKSANIQQISQPAVPQVCNLTISKNDDWQRVNDSQNRIICVLPGDYRGAGAISLTQSGGPGTERYLIYFNPSDDGSHPVKMNNPAILTALNIQGNYWIIRRLTLRGGTTNNMWGNHNILDSMLIENTTERAFDLHDYADYNAIQNSVIRNTRPVPGVDNPCIAMGGARNLKIVNNEIYNCTDGIVASQGPIGTDGMVIENNDIYVTSSYYTSDGRSCAENGIDIKQGGSRGNPVVIRHNRLWGHRPNASGCGGNGATGEAIVIHENDGNPSDYVLVEGNVIFDSTYGISAPNPGSDHVSLIGNLLYRIGYTPGSTSGAAFSLGKSDRWEVYLNSVIDSRYFLDGSGTNSDIRCNLFINSNSWTGSIQSGAAMDYNAFFNTAVLTNGRTNVVGANSADARDAELCITTKRLTGNERFCIPNAVPSVQSPHYRACDATLGARSDVGIDDQPLY